jgi:hypothetical protein
VGHARRSIGACGKWPRRCGSIASAALTVRPERWLAFPLQVSERAESWSGSEMPQGCDAFRFLDHHGTNIKSEMSRMTISPSAASGALGTNPVPKE